MKKRAIKSFEAEKDVSEMLNRAQESGLTLGEILNEALRKYGPRTISEIAAEKQRKLASFPVAPDLQQALAA